MATKLTKPVVRLAGKFIIALTPDIEHDAFITIREKGRRGGDISIAIGRLYTSIHIERAGLPLRRAPVRSRRKA